MIFADQLKTVAKMLSEGSKTKLFLLRMMDLTTMQIRLTAKPIAIWVSTPDLLLELSESYQSISR